MSGSFAIAAIFFSLSMAGLTGCESQLKEKRLAALEDPESCSISDTCMTAPASGRPKKESSAWEPGKKPGKKPSSQQPNHQEPAGPGNDDGIPTGDPESISISSSQHPELEFELVEDHSDRPDTGTLY